MAAVNFSGFIGGAYQSSSWKAAQQRCVNLYPEKDPEKGAVLYGTPGVNQTIGELSTLIVSDLQVLGLMSTPKGLIVATDRAIYRATTAERSGTFVRLTGASLIGLYGPSSYVSMAQAGDRFMVVNGSYGVWAELTGTVLNPIASPGFPANPQTCTAVDGLFVAHGPETDQFFWSAPFDPSSWDALDFASAENLNDSIRRLANLEREMYAIGDLSTEIWAVVGGDEVFDRIQGTFIPYGTPAQESVASIGQSLLWLAQDQFGGSFVVQARGLQVTKVSTNAIDQEIARYETKSDAYAVTYQQHGHAFYCLTFPTEHKTWVYDLSESEWHERASPFSENGSRTELQWSPRCHAYFQGFNLVGAPLGGGLAARVASLETDHYYDNGMPIRRVRTSPHVFKDGQFHTINSLEFHFQPGVGVASSLQPDQLDPVAQLRISKDGGRNWGYQRSKSIGEQGQYDTRCVFHRAGRARDFIAELSISSPVPVVVTGATIDID